VTSRRAKAASHGAGEGQDAEAEAMSELEVTAESSTGAVVSRRHRSLRRLIITRAALFGLAAVGFYLVWPGLLELFSAWPQLTTLQPAWFAAVAVAEAASFVSLWGPTKLARRSREAAAPVLSQDKQPTGGR
jgi:hypothetical protein